MKNLKKLTVILIVFLSSLIVTTVFAANTAKVNSETARMRSKADAKASIVTLISMNEKVEVIEENGGWTKVKYNGKTGYISTSLLDMDNKKSTKNTTTNNTTNNTTKETSNQETSTNTTVNNEVNNVAKQDTKTDTEKENINKMEFTEGFKGKVKAKVDVRILPLINSSKILQIDENTEIEIIEICNNWCRIKVSNNYGWVLKNQLENSIEVQNTEEPQDNEENKDDEISNEEEENNEEQNTTTQNQTTSRGGYINVDTVNVRKEKSITSTILTSLTKHTEVVILEEEDNWCKVKVNGVTGYIASKYISDRKTDVTSRAQEEARQPSATENTNTTPNTVPTATPTATPVTTPTVAPTSSNGQAIVNCAKKYLGTKYVLGGTSPSAGFDCSGLTYYVYKQFGKNLSRGSTGQAKNGTAVDKSNLQAGDIVVFNNGSNTSVGHVGIYMGNNQFIHAANEKKGVVVTSMSNSYYSKRFVTARRIN